MAKVTVFVDDAVLGRLPDVCAKEGTPTDYRFTISQEVGRDTRLGVLWLLVLAGPLGWIILLFLSGRDGGERLTVELPWSEAAYERYTAPRGLRRQATGVALIGAGLMFLGALGGRALAALALPLLVVVVIAIVVALVAAWRTTGALVDIQLDASRRWVTLNRVHENFAAACHEQNQRARRD